MELKDMDEIIMYAKDDIEFKNALNRITEHVINKNFYYRNTYSVNKKDITNQDFANQNQRRSYYIDSHFTNCNFTGCGFTDSIFNGTHFYNCEFDNSNFEACYMFGCYFKNNSPYKYASFAKTFMSDTIFSNIDFENCKLSDTVLYNTTITNCNFDNTSFDGAIFNDVTLDNVSFKNLNLEYTQFNKIQINDSALPFPTIPYIVNGINYLVNTTDDVYIKSAKNGRLTKEEYISLLPDLKIYYEKTQGYFPLANIYIAEKNTRRAFDSIKSGIMNAVFLNNYRQLKNFCFLVNSCDQFSMQQRKSLVNLLSKELNMRMLTNYEFYRPISEHFLELKNLLLCSNNISVIISFKTNIENYEYYKIALFYKTLDCIISAVGIKSNYNINFSYNSTAEIIATLNSLDTGVIVALITAFTTIFISGIKGLSQLPDVITKFASIKHNIEMNKLELEAQKLENTKTSLEITQLTHSIDMKKELDSKQYFDMLIENTEAILSNCEELNKSDIKIDNINYNSFNIDIATLNEYIKNLIYNEKCQ